MVRVVVWNINRSEQALEELLSMDADVALLQEVHVGGWERLARVGNGVEVSPHEPWLPWERTAYDRWPLVVKLSDRVRVDWFRNRGPAHWPSANQLPVSGIGTIAVASVAPVEAHDTFIAASMYARLRQPHPTVGDREWIHSDGSMHRIISELSVFISPRDGATHRILTAGDLNMRLLGRSRPDGRVESILARLEALGLEYIGPQTAEGEPVPTFYKRSEEASTASRPLDHAFASRGFHEGMVVGAMNGADEWGPSDHCRITIDIPMVIPVTGASPPAPYSG